MGEQNLDQPVRASVVCCEVQDIFPMFVSGVNVRSPFQEGLDRRQVVSGGSQHQGVQLSGVFRRVDVGPMIQQDIDDPDMAPRGGPEQRGSIAPVAPVDVSPMLQEQFYNLHVSFFGGIVEGGSSGGLVVVGMNIGSTGQQGFDRFIVTLFDGFNQLVLFSGSDGARDEQQDDGQKWSGKAYVHLSSILIRKMQKVMGAKTSQRHRTQIVRQVLGGLPIAFLKNIWDYSAMYALFFCWVISAFLLPGSIFAYEVKLKGSLEADVLKLEQIKRQENDRSLRSGITRLDLKIHGRFDRLESKIKIDLDNRSLSQPYNLFEEATLKYQISSWLRIKMGKGVVPFHLKRRGVLKRDYRDSGSELDPEHSWRDQDKKILLSFIHGGKKVGWINSLTLWGNSSRPIYKNGELDFIGQEGAKDRKLSYGNHITFDFQEEQGFADKLEIFFNPGHVLSFAAIFHNSKWNPHWSYALDTSYHHQTEKREVWFEYTYGVTSTHWGAKNAVAKNKEHLVQLGWEQYLNSHFNWITNTEYAVVKKENHPSLLGNIPDNDGLAHNMDTLKLETGIKLKFPDHNGYFVFGAFYEQKHKISGGVARPKETAFQLANTLTFRF